MNLYELKQTMAWRIPLGELLGGAVAVPVLPAGAVVQDAWFDAGAQQLCVRFWHPLFVSVPPCQPTPTLHAGAVT